MYSNDIRPRVKKIVNMAEDVAWLLCAPFYGKDALNMDCTMYVTDGLSLHSELVMSSLEQDH